MDPRERADATLARARARGAFVVTPESAVSPMDAANTLQIPRVVVAENDERRDDPEATLIVPNPLLAARPGQVAENIPAIAQESFTDVVSSPPGIRSRRRRIEDARARQQQQAQQRAEEPDEKLQTQDTADLEELVQSNQQQSTMRSLSQRLDG